MATEQTAGRTRGYVILENRPLGIRDGEDAWGWTQVGTVDATSQDGAIRAYVEELSRSPGPGRWELVAVPLRSWRPVTVERKAEWRTVIGDETGTPEPEPEHDDDDPDDED